MVSPPPDSLSAFVAVAVFAAVSVAVAFAVVVAVHTLDQADPDSLSLRRISSAGQILLPMKPEKIVIHQS